MIFTPKRKLNNFTTHRQVYNKKKCIRISSIRALYAEINSKTIKQHDCFMAKKMKNGFGMAQYTSTLLCNKLLLNQDPESEKPKCNCDLKLF